ncbi:MAG TPA: glycosyltransferase [Opitutaceae bacterium]
MPFSTSVLINNYNNERYLRACVDSALNQTQPADEVVVYDDGSTDGSLDILRSYGNRIVLIEGVHDNNRPSRASQSNAVYQGFLHSHGDFLFLLDGDDVFHPTKVEKIMGAIGEQNDISMAQSPCTLIDETGALTGHYRDERFHVLDARAATYAQNDVDFFYPTSAMVVSRAALQRILPLDMSICPQLACDTRIAMCTPLLGRVITVDVPLASWRRHRNSYISVIEQSRWFQAKQTYRRVRTFNAVAPHFHAPGIRLSANRRYWKQVIGALLPSFLRNRLRKNASVVAASNA